MKAVFLCLFFAVAGESPGRSHACAVSCRCPCQRCGPCPCDGVSCPVDVLVTGSLSERATLPVAGLRMRRIACPDVARGEETR